MNITKIAIENNRLTIMAILMMFVLGITSYKELPRDAMPPIVVRTCSIVTHFPGASPERMEALVTDKIEKVVQETPELSDVVSESRTGLSIIKATVLDNVPEENIQAVWDRLRRKIKVLESDLPAGIYPPLLKDENLGTVYGIQLALKGEDYSFKELKDLAETVRDDLIKLKNASKVKITGIQDEQIYVEYDNAILAKMGMTALQLRNYIATTNIVFPGGDVSLENERIVLEPSGNYESLEDIEKTLINIGQQRKSIPLGDIAQLKRAYKNPTNRIVKVDSEMGLVIGVSLKKGANIIALGEEIDEKVAYFNQTLPIGVQLKRIASVDDYVGLKISDFMSNVAQSVIIVLVVMLLFLGFRTGLTVASLIPLTLISSFFFLQIFQVGLNQVSLAALIMALGMLVDNAIVVTEAMMVKMQEGMLAKQAALESCKELIVPMLVSSLTTSAAFLAFFIAENVMGELVGPLFVVITITLLISWLLSMTIIPIIAMTLIRVKALKKQGQNHQAKQGIFERFTGWYKKTLSWVLQRSVLFVFLTIGLFFLSFTLMEYVPFLFFPRSDRNLVAMDLYLPLGTKLEQTNKVVAEVEAFIDENLKVNDFRVQGIKDYASFIADGPAKYDKGYQVGETNSGFAHFLLNTQGEEGNELVIELLESFCFYNLPDAQVKLSRLMIGGVKPDIGIRLMGSSSDELSKIAIDVKRKLHNLGMAKNIRDDWGPKIKKLSIDIDQAKANRVGINNQDIALSLRTALSGFDAGDFRDGEDNIPIIMRNQRSQELSAMELKSLPIFSQQTGQNVPLAQVATISNKWQFAQIKRRNLYRTMEVSADAIVGFTPSDINEEFMPWLEEEAKKWKPGYRFELGGESQRTRDAMGAVLIKLPFTGFIIIILLIGQFNSFRKTGIVLSTIPLGITGVILGLFIFQSYFGFMAFLGAISLAGIVINNAIVLIDRIQIEEEVNHKAPFAAIVDAAEQRFRPILLTTFTTSLGLIPLYMGGGIMWEPMAVALMIGLLFATIITLFFVPALYKILFRVKKETNLPANKPSTHKTQTTFMLAPRSTDYPPVFRNATAKQMDVDMQIRAIGNGTTKHNGYWQQFRHFLKL